MRNVLKKSLFFKCLTGVWGLGGCPDSRLIKGGDVDFLTKIKIKLINLVARRYFTLDQIKRA